MSELEQATSGANTSTSGEVQKGQEPTSTSGDSGSQSYDAKFVEKLKKEKENYKLELEQLRSYKSDKEEKDLLEAKQFETLRENYKKEKTDLEQKLSTLESTMTKAKITSSVLTELKKLGLNDTPENKELVVKIINTENVAIDPQTNMVVGAGEVAKDFHSKYNSLGLFGKQAKTANHQAPIYDSGNTAVKPLSELTEKEREERLKGSLTNLLGG